MPKNKNRKKQQAQAAVLKYILQPGLLEDLDLRNAEEVKRFVDTIDRLQEITGKSKGFLGFFRQIRLCLDLTRNKHPRIFDTLKTLNERAQKQPKEGIATHPEKRTLVYQLHLAQKHPKSLADLMAGSPFDPEAPTGTIMNPRIVWRKRDLSFGPSLRTVLADTKCRPNSGDFVCDVAAGFYRVGINESVIFVDENESGEIVIELIALRGVFGDQAQADAIFRWFQRTIDDAITVLDVVVWTQSLSY
ncbi:hypothetical protein C8R45DRAFT_1115928 [Mycena sanguinolenta]|nr:hypothetical protein C8R45DRAFT_1115928 [Mycena sanguinolenta]